MASWPEDWPAQQAALHEVAAAALPGFVVIWGGGQGPGQRSEGPIPASPFATLRVVGMTQETAVPWEDEAGRVYAQGRFTLEVQTFSRDPHPIALEQLRISLASMRMRERLREAGLVALWPPRMRDLSTIIGDRREHRRCLEVDLAVELGHQAEAPGIIDRMHPAQVALTATSEGPADTTAPAVINVGPAEIGPHRPLIFALTDSESGIDWGRLSVTVQLGAAAEAQAVTAGAAADGYAMFQGTDGEIQLRRVAGWPVGQAVQARLQVYDHAGNLTEHARSFTVPDTTAPTVIDVGPAAMAEAGRVAFEVTDAESGVDWGSLAVTAQFGSDPAQDAVTAGAAAAGFTLDRSGARVQLGRAAAWPAGAQLTVRLQVADVAGNVRQHSRQLQVQDTAPPVLTGQLPATLPELGALVFSATDAGLGVDFASLAASVQLGAGGPTEQAALNGVALPGYTLTRSGPQLSLQRGQPWPPSTEISLSVRVSDLAGNEAQGRFEATSQAAVDRDGPVITGQLPATLAADGALVFEVTDAGSGVDWAALGATVQLGGLAAAPAVVAGVAQAGFTLDRQGAQVRLRRAEAWPYSSPLTLRVSAADAEGNPAEASFQATVQAAPDLTPPVLAHVGPVMFEADGAVSVSVQDAGAGVDWARLSATMGGAQAITAGAAAAGFSMQRSGDQVSLSRAAAWPEGASVQLVVTAYDLAGNHADYTRTFTVRDRTAPTITNQTPAQLAATGPLLFALRDDGAGLDLSTLGVEVEVAGQRQAAVVAGEAQAGFTLQITAGAAQLRRAAAWPYDVEVSASVVVADAHGNQASELLSATVQAAPDTTPPTVTRVGTGLVGVDQPLSFVVLDDGAGVSWPSLYVSCTQGGAAVGVQISRSGDQVDLRPQAGNWAYNAQLSCTVRVQDAASNQAEAQVTAATTADTQPPAVTLQTAAPAALAAPVVLSVLDSVSGVDWAALAVQVTVGGSALAVTQTRDGAQVSVRPASGDWPASVDLALSVAVRDLAGNAATLPFSLRTADPADTTGPQVSLQSTAPLGLSTPLVLSVVDAASGIDWGTLAVQVRTGGQLLQVTTTHDAATVTVRPSAGAWPAEAELAITVQVSDVPGNPTTAQLSIQTAPPADTAAPTVVFVTPAAPAELAPNAALVFTATDPGGVNWSTLAVSVRLGSGALVQAVIAGAAQIGFTLTRDGDRATLTRAAAWPYATAISAQLTVQDAAGNEAQASFSGTVQAAPDTTAPTIAEAGPGVLPRAGAQLQAQITDDGSGVDWATLDVRLTVAGVHAQAVTAGVAQAGFTLARQGQTVTITRAAAFVGAEAVAMRIQVQDVADNQAEAERDYTVEAVPAPTLALSGETSPLAPAGAVVLVASGETIDWASLQITAGGASAVVGGAAQAGFTVVRTGGRVELRRDAGWGAGALEVSAQLASLGGGQQATAAASLTVAAPDTTAPTIAAVTVGELAADAPFVLSVTDAGSGVNWGSLTVTATSAGAAAAVTTTQAGDRISVRPASGDWAAGAALVFAVQVSDAAGNPASASLPATVAAATTPGATTVADPLFSRAWEWYMVGAPPTAPDNAGPGQTLSAITAGAPRALTGEFNWPHGSPLNPVPALGEPGRGFSGAGVSAGHDFRQVRSVRAAFVFWTTAAGVYLFELRNHYGDGVDYTLQVRWISGGRLSLYWFGQAPGGGQAISQIVLDYPKWAWCLLDVVTRPRADGGFDVVAMVNGQETVSATPVAQLADPSRNGGGYQLGVGRSVQAAGTTNQECLFLGASDHVITLAEHRTDAARLGLYTPPAG